MQIQCPKCSQIQEVRKDDVMGRYFVCRCCHHTFSWERQVYIKKPGDNSGTEKPFCT